MDPTVTPGGGGEFVDINPEVGPGTGAGEFLDATGGGIENPLGGAVTDTNIPGISSVPGETKLPEEGGQGFTPNVGDVATGANPGFEGTNIEFEGSAFNPNVTGAAGMNPSVDRV